MKSAHASRKIRDTVTFSMNPLDSRNACKSRDMEPSREDIIYKQAETLLRLYVVLSVIVIVLLVATTTYNSNPTSDSLSSKMVIGTSPFKELYQVVSSIEEPFPAPAASNSITTSSFLLKGNLDGVTSEMIDSRLTVAPEIRQRSPENDYSNGPSEQEEESERVMQETLEINYAAEQLLMVDNLSDEENHETVALPIDGSDISGFGSMSRR